MSTINRTMNPRELLVQDGTAESRIDGVALRALKVNRDPRGTLTELLRADWPDLFGAEMPFAQVYTSTTGAGVARDEQQWHVHRYQTDRFGMISSFDIAEALRRAEERRLERERRERERAARAEERAGRWGRLWALLTAPRSAA